MFVSSTIVLSADLDVVAIKKGMSDDADKTVKIAIENATKKSAEFKLNEVLSELMIKTYPKDQHESARMAEEAKLIDRINTRAAEMKKTISDLVEKAFVDVLSQQNAFNDACQKDCATFSQQFAENVSKMMQGKGATSVTYSSKEGVAKAAEKPTEAVIGKKKPKDTKPLAVSPKKDFPVPANMQPTTKTKDEPKKAAKPIASAPRPQPVAQKEAEIIEEDFDMLFADDVNEPSIQEMPAEAPLVAPEKLSQSQAEMLKKIRG